MYLELAYVFKTSGKRMSRSKSWNMLRAEVNNIYRFYVVKCSNKTQITMLGTNKDLPTCTQYIVHISV